MKKLVLALCLLTGLSTYAASLKVTDNYSVGVASEEKADHPVLSPDGNKMLYSTSDFVGLKMLDLSTGKVETISESVAAGFRPVISGEGNVYYRNSEMQGRLRFTNLMEWSSENRQSIELIPMNRDNCKMQVRDGKLLVKSNRHSIGLSDNVAMAYEDYDAIVVHKDGKEMRIKPLGGDYTYLYASLSPDGNKIAFAEPYKGIYTCNLDGSDLKFHGRGDNPQWVSNDFIAFVKSKHDGYFVLEARMYVVNLATGNAIALTDESVKVTDISAASQVNKLAYSTEGGGIYIVEFEITK